MMNLKSVQVAVTSTEKKLHASVSAAKTVYLSAETDEVFLGVTGLSITTGFRLPTGTVMKLEAKDGSYLDLTKIFVLTNTTATLSVGWLTTAT